MTSLVVLAACGADGRRSAQDEMQPLVAAKPSTELDGERRPPNERCTIALIAVQMTAIVDPTAVRATGGNRMDLTSSLVIWQRVAGASPPTSVSAATGLLDIAVRGERSQLLVLGGDHSATLVAVIDREANTLRTPSECDGDLNESLARVELALDGAPAEMALAALAGEIATMRPGKLQSAASWT